MKTIVANGITWTRFNNCTEFFNVSDSRQFNMATRKYSDGWAGHDAVTYTQALALARAGWKTGRSEIIAIARNISVAGKVKRPEYFYDVQGEYGYDIGRIMQGDPECMLDMRETDVQDTSGDIIKIIVNVTFSGGIDEKIIRVRGAAILALVEALEMSGRTVEIDCIFAESPEGYCGDPGVGVYVPVKRAGEHIQFDKVAFAVAHPSFSRRFGHGVTGRAIMPGTPRDIAKECDMYIPEAYLADKQWRSEAACIAWVTEKLASFGVKLTDKKRA